MISETPKRVLMDLHRFPKAKKYIKTILRGDKAFTLYGGGVRGGKTFNSLAAMAMLLDAYPGSRAIIVRKDLPTLIRNTFPTCQKVFPRKLKLVNRTRYVWEMPAKDGKPPSTVFFFPENYSQDKEMMRWDGLEFNFAFVDQIEELQEQTFTKINERVGSYFIPGVSPENQPNPRVFATCNPTNRWLKELVYDRWLKGTLPHDWEFVESLVTDNPHVSPKYLAQLEKLRDLNPFEYRRRVQGIWEVQRNELGLFDPECIMDLFSNTFVGGGNKKYITADIALHGSDKFVIMVWDGWRVIDVSYYDKIDSDSILKIIELKRLAHNIPYSRIAYDADGVGGFLRGRKRNMYAFINNSPPLGKPGSSALPNYKNLKTQCFYLMADKIDNHEMYVDCSPEVQKMLVQELNAIERIPTGDTSKLAISDKRDIKATIGRSPDFAECLAMRMVFELRKTRKSVSGTM